MYDLFFENHLSKQTVFLSKHNLELVIFFLARSYYGVYSYLRLFLGPRFNSFRTTPMHVFSAQSLCILSLQIVSDVDAA